MNCTFNYQECAGKKNILVTQYPLQETVVDFWTMVYDTDSTVVVVLELLNEVCTSYCKFFISNPVIVLRINVWTKEQFSSMKQCSMIVMYSKYSVIKYLLKAVLFLSNIIVCAYLYYNN